MCYNFMVFNKLDGLFMIYIIGKLVDGDQWEVQGVFDKEIDAVNACHKDWFVMPCEKNKVLPLEGVEVGYYPHLSGE